MASVDWSQLMEQAAAEGFVNEVLPDGPYEVEVVSAQAGQSKGGKAQISIRLRILSGPHANKTVWDNLTLSPESPKSMAVFFRKAYAYGATEAQFRAGHDLEQIAASFSGQGVAQLGHHAYNGNDQQDVKSFKRSGANQGMTIPVGVPQTVGLVVPQPPQTAPQPQFMQPPQGKSF